MSRNSAPDACIAHALCLAGTQHIAQVPTLPFFFFCTKRDEIIKEKKKVLVELRFYSDYVEPMIMLHFFLLPFLTLMFPIPVFI